jgi:hypothetical protein
VARDHLPRQAAGTITVAQAGCALTITAPGEGWSPATGTMAGIDAAVCRVRTFGRREYS